MSKSFGPYYASRALLSAAFSMLVFGLSWKALVMAGVVFALFLVYLHSGWFGVDPSNPLFPLRRDERAREAQRKALVAATLAGAMGFVAITAIASASTAAAAPLAISVAVLVYFASQFLLLAGT
jgi:hypothetical protein